MAKHLTTDYGTYTSDPVEAKTDKNTISNRILNEEMTKGSELHDLLNSNGIFRREDMQDFDRFYIFPRNDPYKMLGTTREYIFITKPDLHIFDAENVGTLNPEIGNDPFFVDLMDRGYQYSVLSNLQLSAKNGRYNPFIPMFTNYKTTNLDLSPINAGDIDTAANAFGTKIYYRRPTDTSNEECEFSLEFKDTKYLDCYLWFKAYDIYEQRKYQGIVSPANPNYVFNKVLSDQMTVFKFIVGEDGESLLYWACIWGCYPKNVPRDSFSDMPTDGQLKFTVNWHGAFQDDMDPLIIIHFNQLSSQMRVSGEKQIELYDTKIQGITQKAAYRPYILGPLKSLMKSDYRDYKLVWIGINE